MNGNRVLVISIVEQAPEFQVVTLAILLASTPVVGTYLQCSTLSLRCTQNVWSFEIEILVSSPSALTT